MVNLPVATNDFQELIIGPKVGATTSLVGLLSTYSDFDVKFVELLAVELDPYDSALDKKYYFIDTITFFGQVIHLYAIMLIL